MCKSPSEYSYSSYNNNRFESNSLISSKIREYINSRKFKVNEDEAFVFMENEDNKKQICEEMLKEFMVQKNVDLNEIKCNKLLLLQLVQKMRDKDKISYDLIGKQIGISREKLRKLIV